MLLMSEMIYSYRRKETSGHTHTHTLNGAEAPAKVCSHPSASVALAEKHRYTHGDSLASSSIPAGSRHTWPPWLHLCTGRSPYRCTGRGQNPSDCSYILDKKGKSNSVNATETPASTVICTYAAFTSILLAFFFFLIDAVFSTCRMLSFLRISDSNILVY